MSDSSEPADGARAVNAARRRRGIGWSVAALVCAIAAVVAWFVVHPFASISPAAVAVLAGVVGIVREPRGRALAIGH